jgi:putative addiction module component (TIGR02574 family)
MLMSTTVEKVRKDALALSTSERASLAHDLILSLDNPANYSLSPTQEAEIQRRVQMVREGKAKGRPAEELFAQINAKRQ